MQMCFIQTKEQKRKNRGLKVRQPQYGFFSRRKLARDKLHRSVRNARDCRERRKLHYQCLEEMVLSREQAIQTLRHELETVKCEVDVSLYQLYSATVYDACVPVCCISTASLDVSVCLHYMNDCTSSF